MKEEGLVLIRVNQWVNDEERRVVLRYYYGNPLFAKIDHNHIYFTEYLLPSSIHPIHQNVEMKGRGKMSFSIIFFLS